MEIYGKTYPDHAYAAMLNQALSAFEDIFGLTTTSSPRS